jgi:hypothetical protein
VQSQQLLPESEIFQDEVLPGTKGTDNPSQKMSERGDDDRNHGQNLLEKRRIQLACKSLIPRVHEVLTRDRERDQENLAVPFNRYRCYFLIRTFARNLSSDSTSAGSATVSAISWRKISRYLLRSL